MLSTVKNHTFCCEFKAHEFGHGKVNRCGKTGYNFKIMYTLQIDTHFGS